jgi:hypothetical protein
MDEGNYHIHVYLCIIKDACEGVKCPCKNRFNRALKQNGPVRSVPGGAIALSAAGIGYLLRCIIIV